MKSRLAAPIAAAVLVAACGGGTQPTSHSSATATPDRAAGAVSLALETAFQVELTLPGGRHIYIDVSDPSLLASAPTKDDVLLITGGVYAQGFADAFPGPKIVAKQDSLSLEGVSIRGVAAELVEGQGIDPENPTDVIFVIVAAGVRIAHFGATGQSKLNAEQLAAVGRVDVAISELFDHHNGVDATTQAGLKLMQQVSPRVFVPMASSQETLKQVADTWTASYTTKPSIRVAAATLPTATTMVLVGPQAATYGKALGLKEAEW